MWYRAIPLIPFGRLFKARVAAPTLIVSGDGDTAVLRPGLELSLRYCTGPARLEVLQGINHWVPDQAPDALSKLIVDHLAEEPVGRSLDFPLAEREQVDNPDPPGGRF
jgi:pimeloyl-ACP methyl ester carboxylesterase